MLLRCNFLRLELAFFDLLVRDTVQHIEQDGHADGCGDLQDHRVLAERYDLEEAAEDAYCKDQTRCAEREHGAAQGVERDTQPEDQQQSDQRGGVQRHGRELRL